jgi:tRNA (cmo5U34)-methyltransferase
MAENWNFDPTTTEWVMSRQDQDPATSPEKKEPTLAEIDAAVIGLRAVYAWEFDANVTDAFDDMLECSIPQYELMRQLTFDLGVNFFQERATIIDLGCSRGSALAPFVDLWGAQTQYIGVEISKPMLEAARRRFKGFIDAGTVIIRDDDLRIKYPPYRAFLTLCVLTMQFIPIERRLQLMQEIYNHLTPGGALILVEKVLGSTAGVDKLLRDRYWTMKRTNGYTQEQIDRKWLALEGVPVPVTAKWNEDLMGAVGFRQVECFWRCLNFAGWVAVRS